VKDATVMIRRMGDMGKLPTSAALVLSGGFGQRFREIEEAVTAPSERAHMWVDALTRIHRIGVKLATMFVSALAVDELTPGFSPWSPDVCARELVVVDTNVGHVIDLLAPSIECSYQAKANWLVRAASTIDLRRRGWSLPHRSPRLVQQALYWFRSASNRRAAGDPCVSGGCGSACPMRACCPFAA